VENALLKPSQTLSAVFYVQHPIIEPRANRLLRKTCTTSRASQFHRRVAPQHLPCQKGIGLV